MRILVATALLVTLLGGCLAADGDGDRSACLASTLDQPGVRLVPTTEDPINDDRDNATVFETTNVRTCSLPAIGWSALNQSGVPHKYLGELDVRGDLDLGAVAVVGSGEPGGVYLIDISDRAKPTVLSFIAQPGAHVTDVKISDDGKVLYTASQAPAAAGSFTGLAGQGATPASPVGFTVYNIEDPAAPRYLGTVPDEGFGCHMLAPVQVSVAPDQDAVMCVSTALKVYLVQRDGPVLAAFGYVPFLQTEDSGAPVLLRPPVGEPSCPWSSQVPQSVPDQCNLATGVHDMTEFHEGGSFGAGSSYLVVSGWDEGLYVLDITQAPLITEVGRWNGAGAEHYGGNVHTAAMFQVGDQRYILASPEYTGSNADTVPSLWLLDASDLGDLRLVGEWAHPGLHRSQGLYLTTHQWQVAPTGPDVTADDVRVYLTYNHAGVWVLDLGAILDGDDQGAILGFNSARTPIPEEHVPNAVLNTWDVGVVDGHIYGTDRATGLWVFHYLGDELGDERLNGFV